MSTIRAAISPSILAKADRLFRNDDAGISIELLQNARRAGADIVNIEIEPLPGDGAGSQITVRDNGRGIDDFQNLLTLGGSGWDANVTTTEDPAGMGFFSLCHSEVLVASQDQEAVLTREVFLGKAEAQVRSREVFVPGTRITFSRPTKPDQLANVLKDVAEFCPLLVRINGIELPRHDFLEGALYREVIDGIEVGFAVAFRWGHGLRENNWNFHGLRISEPFQGIPGVLTLCKHRGWISQTLEMRFNVLETGRVKLQLPDRRAIVQDETFRQFMNKVRAAAYRFFQAQERHVLPFASWKEAGTLGVPLQEASPLLKTWRATPLDDSLDPFFGMVETNLLSDAGDVLLVSAEVEDRHTLEAALQSSTLLEGALYQEAAEFRGYSWYDRLPRITHTSAIVDGVPFVEWNSKSLPRPESIELVVRVARPDQEDGAHRLPIAVHVVDDAGRIWESGELEFVAVRNSSWDNDSLSGPFDIADFLFSATFQSSDDADADSWDTQRSRHREDVERTVNEYFRGPRSALLALLEGALSWDARHYADETGVKEIRFRKQPGTPRWQIELVSDDPPALAA